MVDTKEGAWIFVAVVIGVVLLGLWDWRRAAEADRVAETEARSAPDLSWEPLPRRRVPIERPAGRRTPAAPTPDAPGSGPSSPVTDPAAPSNPRAEVPEVEGAAPDLTASLKAAMSAVTGKMLGCLAGWHDAQPDVFAGQAVFAIHLDTDGLAELEVLDVDTVPPATMTCLGEVLWDEVDWPEVAGPLEVTWPVQVSVDTDE